jgi:hypothetical protein
MMTADYTGKWPKTFRFRGTPYAVRTFEDILLGLCAELKQLYPNEFESKVLQWEASRGRKRTYFARSPNGMKQEKRLPGTQLFVETKFSANHLINHVCRDVLEIFGYSLSSLEVECVSEAEVEEV